MSKCTILFHARAGGRPGTFWSSFFPPLPAPSCIFDLILRTNPGDLVCFFSGTQHQCSLSPGWHAKTTFGSSLSLMEWVQVDTSLRTKRSAYIGLWLARALLVTGKATCLVPSPAFAQLLRLLRPQTARS